MPPGIRVVAVHIKVRYHAEVIQELTKLGLPNIEIGECEKEYDFRSLDQPVTVASNTL